LVVKGRYISVVDILIANPRLKYFSLKRLRDLVRDDYNHRAIRSRIEADNIR